MMLKLKGVNEEGTISFMVTRKRLGIRKIKCSKKENLKQTHKEKEMLSSSPDKI